MPDFASKIKLLRDQSGLSRRAFGELLGVPESKIQKIEIGKQRADHEFLASVAKSLDVDMNWLISNDISEVYSKSPENIEKAGFVPIPKFTVSASAGNGSIVGEEMEVSRYAFSQDWIKRRNLNIPQLYVISVRGDSMEPKLADGDLILIDRGQSELFDGLTYVVRLHDELVVKAIQRIDKETISLISANAQYPPRDISLPVDGDTTEIIGRVVASMHEW